MGLGRRTNLFIITFDRREFKILNISVITPNES